MDDIQAEKEIIIEKIFDLLVNVPDNMLETILAESFSISMLVCERFVTAHLWEFKLAERVIAKRRAK